MFEPLHVIPCERNKRTHCGSLVLFPKDGLPVGEVGNVNVRCPSPKAVAYANLFSAAPELLQQLKDAIGALRFMGRDDDSEAQFNARWESALLAIKKAEGR